MAKTIAVVVFSVLLSACSWTDAAKFLTPAAKDGINADAEVTVGQKNEEMAVDTRVGDSSTSTQTAQEIVNANKYSGITTFQLLLFALLAGWALPDPQTMGRGVITFMRSILPWGK